MDRNLGSTRRLGLFVCGILCWAQAAHAQPSEVRGQPSEDRGPGSEALVRGAEYPAQLPEQPRVRPLPSNAQASVVRSANGWKTSPAAGNASPSLSVVASPHSSRDTDHPMQPIAGGQANAGVQYAYFQAQGALPGYPVLPTGDPVAAQRSAADYPPQLPTSNGSNAGNLPPVSNLPAYNGNHQPNLRQTSPAASAGAVLPAYDPAAERPAQQLQPPYSAVPPGRSPSVGPQPSDLRPVQDRSAPSQPPQSGQPANTFNSNASSQNITSGLPYVTPPPQNSRSRYATSPYQPAVFQLAAYQRATPTQLAGSSTASVPTYLTAQQTALPQYQQPGIYPTAYQCTPAAPSFPSTGAVPGAYVPPTLPPNLTPGLYTPNNAGYSPVFSLGQENYNVLLGRGIIGQPTVYVPGQPIRNFMRYLSP